MISTFLANTVDINVIHTENVHIQTCYEISFHGEVFEIPIFSTQNIQIHKFYMFDFHAKYNKLIGIDHLHKFKAILEIYQKRLITPSVVIPVHYDDKTQKTYQKNIIQS